MTNPAPAAPAPAGAVPSPRPRRLHPLLVLFLVWTCVGLFFGARRYINVFLFDGRLLTDLRPLAANLFDAYFWAPVTLLVFWLVRRFRFTRRGWPLAVLVHVVMALSLAFVSVLLNIWFSHVLWPNRPATFRDYFQLPFYINIQWYVVITIVWYAIEYARRYHDREVQAAQLGTRLAEARLEALKMQIQPHFLFNTLHSISELVHEDAEAADRMITRLGDLLRLTVDNAQTHEVTLAQEMEFLEAYLEIQRTRFQDTLEVELSIAPDTLDALVPNLVLQPLVENAIRHGVGARGGVGRIAVSAAREGDRLTLEVRDNGAGLSAAPGPRAREGVGVSNTRARLEQMYGARQRFELKNGSGGGAVATVTIPFRLAPAAADTRTLAVGAPA
ncbi:MAG TPA: histidine kinase [Longimicrobium sp.]|jgi:sensor histidine kinase YesM